VKKIFFSAAALLVVGAIGAEDYTSDIKSMLKVALFKKEKEHIYHLKKSDDFNEELKKKVETAELKQERCQLLSILYPIQIEIDVIKSSLQQIEKWEQQYT